MYTCMCARLCLMWASAFLTGKRRINRHTHFRCLGFLGSRFSLFTHVQRGADVLGRFAVLLYRLEHVSERSRENRWCAKWYN